MIAPGYKKIGMQSSNTNGGYNYTITYTHIQIQHCANSTFDFEYFIIREDTQLVQYNTTKGGELNQTWQILTLLKLEQWLWYHNEPLISCSVFSMELCFKDGTTTDQGKSMLINQSQNYKETNYKC